MPKRLRFYYCTVYYTGRSTGTLSSGYRSLSAVQLTLLILVTGKFADE